MARAGWPASRLHDTDSEVHKGAVYDWDDLKPFLAVARHGSTVAAAKALGVSQATVHRRLAELERRLGCQLVQRHPGGYRLTKLGTDALARAERVEDAAAAFARQILASKNDLRGIVRLTCPEAFGSRLMRSGLLDRFHAQHPEIAVELALSDRSLDLGKGQADIAIRAEEPRDPNLFGRKIADSQWAMYASETYVARRGRIERLQDLARHAVVGFDGELADHRAGLWLRSVAPKARIAARCSSLPALLLAARSGSGVALLPTVVGDSEGDLVQVFGPVREVVTPFYLLMHRDLRRTPHVRALFDFIVSEIKTIGRMLAGDGRAAADHRTKP